MSNIWVHVSVNLFCGKKSSSFATYISQEIFNLIAKSQYQMQLAYTGLRLKSAVSMYINYKEHNIPGYNSDIL